ncbi:hypothetical protein [Thaumasiovibrio sp. DFM-14]|uniref:hypothetical protein n=1 Tax=Thaumasiovibrio sp. DFM-14 TaxID=3384792 RepID=UPI0039A3D9B1
MKIKLLSVVLGALLVSACSSTQVGIWDDREELLNDLAQRCEAHTSGYQQYSPTFDQASQALLAVTRRQCAAAGEYRTIRENHKDVEQFFAAHAALGLSNEEIAEQLIDNEEMAKKFAQYQQAQDAIFEQNMELAIELGLVTAETTLLFAENMTTIAKIEVIKRIQGELDPEGDTLPLTLEQMQTRLSIVNEGQSLINAEKSFLDDMKAADKALQERISIAEGA